jgi:hypothetical protein
MGARIGPQGTAIPWGGPVGKLGKAVELTLLVEEVVPLESAAEAVQRLAGLSDPEPHRVHRLPQARHLPEAATTTEITNDGEEAVRPYCEALVGLKISRGRGTEPSRAGVLGDWAWALGFPVPFWNDHFTHLVRSAVM